MSIATPQGTQLTEYQAEYLIYFENGMTIPEIALRCGVSTGSVSRSIYQVLNRELSERILTARQLEILALVGAGYGDQEIGRRLFLSSKTVENQVKMARERLGARNRLHCVVVAIAFELLILNSDGELHVPHALRAVV